MDDFIKSPLNYIGGKYKILPQIFDLFPTDVDCFVDLFAGGANVGINSTAKKIILNDNLVHLVDMYETLAKMPKEAILDHIDKKIAKFDLSLTNTEGYNQFREHYNSLRHPLDLLILTFFSFNHQIRFNNSHHFNTPFGKNRSRYNASIKKNLVRFLDALHSKNIEFQKNEFDKFDFSTLTSKDFVYCDPPYLITVGSYNDGKRGFTGWGEAQEKQLLAVLDELNNRNIRFALSNVLTHKGVNNNLLQDWLNKNGFAVYDITNDFTNSNYHTSLHEKEGTREVLITNYNASTKRKHWFNEDGLELVEPDPRWDNPDYEPVEQPRPTDIVYKLDYDNDLRYLKLNTFTVQTFQFESHADRVFGELFKQEGDIKTVSVHSPAKADVIVNNIAMPIKLRNAMFTTGSKGTRLQVHTVITRERAKKFGVNDTDVRAYIDKSRDTHYRLLDANKRK